MVKSPLDKLREAYHYSRYKFVKKLIEDEGKDLLDIGCGKPCDSMENGAFLRYMGYGTGMDIVEYNLESQFKQGSITDIPFADNSFDVAVALEVLEHVEDVNKALSEVKRVLRLGGVFVMSTPNNSLLWKTVWFLWERTIGKMWKHKHITNLDKKQWLELLGKYFKIELVSGLFGILLLVKCEKRDTRNLIKDFKMFPTGSCAYNISRKIKTQKDARQAVDELSKEYTKHLKQTKENGTQKKQRE